MCNVSPCTNRLGTCAQRDASPSRYQLGRAIPVHIRFYLPDFLSVPGDSLDLGVAQSGRRVGEVLLPPWANGSPAEFVRIHRQVVPTFSSLSRERSSEGVTQRRGGHWKGRDGGRDGAVAVAAHLRVTRKASVPFVALQSPYSYFITGF